VTHVRGLQRSPIYTLVAIVTLALGIGATTAVFTVVGSVLLKPLPFADPDRLMSVYAGTLKGDSIAPSFPAFEEMRQQADVFSGFAYVLGDGALFRRGGENEPVVLAVVSDDFFPLLSAKPALGRLLLPRDNRPDAPPVAVLSHEMWTNDFGGDPQIVGKTIHLTRGQFTVVGALAAGQAYPDWIPGLRTQVYVPMAAAPYLRTKLSHRENHSDARAIARLKPGITRAQAERELKTLAANLAVSYPATDSLFPTAFVSPLRDQVVGGIGPAFAVLTVAVVFVLLLACADVANLALVRAVAREREIAVRTALGAGRGRIARALLIESGILAACGLLLGVLLAAVAVPAFVAAAPPTVPRLQEIHLDWRALLAAVGATTLAIVICGLVPLAATGRGDLVAALKAGTRGAGAARRGLRVRGAIVTAQVALSVVLIAGAGLLIKSFARLSSVSPGFDTRHLIGLHLATPPSRETDPALRLAFLRRAAAAFEIPGVTSVSFANHRALSPGGTSTQAGPDGRNPASDSIGAFYTVAYPGYFATMGIPILKGREFTDADLASSQVYSIVSAYAGKRYWPNGDAIGHSLTVINGATGDSTYGKPIHTIVVGVAGDVKKFTLDENPFPMVYVSAGPVSTGLGDVVIRTAGAPAPLLGPIRRAVAALDPDIAVRDLGTGDQWIAENVSRQQFVMTLLAIFSGVALTLAALGLYGVIAYSVTQRTSELGIRMALGAGAADVVGLVARGATMLVGVGLVLGAAGAIVLGRAMRSLLYGVGPNDPATLLTVAAILVAVAALASYVPARRAARVDPVIALRAE
jgi:putative ABC transport system permease protein